MGAVAGADAAGQTPQAAEPAHQQVEAETEQLPEKPGFAERGQMRRRARFLRKARELAYRDLGGLVFDLHRFGQRNDPLVLAKLAMLRQLDTELRELERVLRERRPVTVLREVGIAACPRCAAIHGSDDRFCPGCGLAFDANADRPISTMPMAPQSQPQAQAPSVQPVASPQAQTPTAQPLASPQAQTPTAQPLASPQAQTPTAQPAASTQAQAPTTAAGPSISTSGPTPSSQAPSAAPLSTPAQTREREQPRPADDEQTQILRPPVRDE